ncbi:DNA-binding response regulator [uncultured Thiohalocapsa sp.]|uniref:response regulator transcription factor n=1 Tax=uncultured Thiohalocapsa sp. TaxID=768990 RepID=UPI0025EE7758|nr:DNA-binding response regulator [uncultured Thiohalocapsa sp.]
MMTQVAAPALEGRAVAKPQRAVATATPAISDHGAFIGSDPDAAKQDLGRADGPAHLLVVDDEPDGLELVIAHLRDYDFAVSTALSGTEALAAAGDALPDLILLDVTLPGLDGFEVLRRLKQAPATATIPVLMVTGHRDTEHKVRCFELGAADYLVKPVAEAELKARVTTQLRQHRLRQALSTRLRSYEERFGPLDEAAAGAAGELGSRTDVELLLRARQILRERLADPPSLTELARLIGTNQPRLSKGFRNLFGTTVYGFVRESRLRRARALLAETNLPVKSIALDVGYRGTSDLTRAVKGHWGLTPTALRQRLKAAPER